MTSTRSTRLPLACLVALSSWAAAQDPRWSSLTVSSLTRVDLEATYRHLRTQTPIARELPTPRVIA